MRTPKIIFYSPDYEDYFNHYVDDKIFKVLIGKGRDYFLYYIQDRRLEKWETIANSSRSLWDARIKGGTMRKTSPTILKELNLLSMPEVP